MIMNVEKSYAVVLLVKSAELCFWYMDLWQDAADSSFMLSADVIPDLPDRLICSVVTRGPVPPVTKNLIIEGLCERTEYINIFLFSAHHSIVFHLQCSVYWWKGSVRF